jgi:arylsulfatase A-like enzyme
VAVGTLVAATAGCSRSHAPTRVILVVIDTLRRDALSCYGGATPTPELDALAAAGTRFTNASSSFHQTTMSMAALFTGRTPSIDEEPGGGKALRWTGKTWCGLARLAHGKDACVPASVPTLAEAFRAAGYRTIGVVSNPLLFRPAGYDRGFDDWREVRQKRDWKALLARRPNTEKPPPAAWWEAQRHTAKQVNGVVRDVVAAPRAGRTFLYVHYMDAHDWQILGTTYQEGVAAADAAFGELWAILRDAGFLDAAVVVVTADHGEALGEPHPLPSGPTHYGEPSFETLLRVPLIVWPPVARDPARFARTDDTSRLLRELAGLRDGAAAELRPEEVFLTEQAYWTYRDGRWKTIQARAGGPTYLFDLVADPAELTDVAAAHPEEVARQRRRIEELSRALAAPAHPDATLDPTDHDRLRALGYAG